MPHRLERDPYSNSPPSPASSDTSVSSNTHATPPRGPQRDFIHPRPVQSLPPLRAFLRNEGIDTDIEPPQQCLVRATHEVAREEARRRAIRAAPTRFSPLLGYESRNAPSLAEHRTIQPLDEVYMPGYNRRLAFSALVDGNRRNRDFRESSPYQKVVRRSMPSSSIASGDDCHARKTLSSLRPCGSRVGTVEERMSREVETFAPSPPLPTPFTLRDETISPILPSRKRPRSAYFDEQSDDEDSERDGSVRLCTSDVPGTGKDQSPVQSDPDDDGLSDSETPPETGDEKERRDPPPRTKGKPSRKPRAEKSLEKGPEREYFSPAGVKLEVVELPVKYDTREWLKHVEQCPDGSRAPWCCTWQTMKNGKRVPCNYSSKKHLVKRHIEATHLCIKRFQCTWCQKTFTQRSNVAGCHLNTHTGASPHGCDFCDDSFKDPSKRHKHMLRIHGYRPGESRKKFRSEESAQSQSVHESLSPWKVGAASEC